ncbi:MAG: DUF1501 domain-containing protein [Pirellulales bacterium]
MPSRLIQARSHSTVMRRDFIRFGSLLAGGLTLDQHLSCLRAQAAGYGARRARNCILLWLDGGPSHLETFDPKRDVPQEVRGPFGTINTTVPGIELCELLPQTARVIDKCAIIRSLTSPLGEHGIANQYLMSGYPPSAQIDYPSIGAVTARMRGASDVPSYVVMPELRPSMSAGYLGSQYEPFTVTGDLARPEFRVHDLDFRPGLDPERLDRRRRRLEELLKDDQTGVANADGAIRSQFDSALQLLLSDRARRAFDLSAEPDRLKQEYGERAFGRGCLLARRLIEHGVSLVTVVQSGWDTHDNLKLQLQDGYSGAKVGVGLIPVFDQAFSALVRDLDHRGLLEDTLIVVLGEFGRTPKVNTRGGRDHWPRVFSAVLAGGGIRGGQVIGSSDRVGESPRDNPVTPEDLLRAVYVQLGIDPDHELMTDDGRPMKILRDGAPIAGLV